MKVIYVFAMLLAFSFSTYAQQRTVSGTVISGDDQMPLPGVSVVVNGTTIGTITDSNGKYQLDIPQSTTTLYFSFIGMEAQEVTLTTQSIYDVTLELVAFGFDEVVVTALGIKREKKALGYSIQELKGEGLNENRDPNVINSLSGKISGLQVKQASTGASGSSRIIIRGTSSIGGSNQPLIVIDGVPANSSTGGTDDYWGNREVDMGSGISDISPDDIESISVLKGAAASALYGSRAGNGVIMITTKSGKSGEGLGISFNSNLTFESPMETPDFQNVYGQGVNGVFDVTAAGSWGGIMDGSSVDALMGTKAYSPAGNDLYKDFLQTGVTSTNSLELSAGNENANMRLGITRMDNKGVVPNSELQRTSLNLRTGGKWNKLSADVKVNYVRQSTENRIKLAHDPDNIFLNYLIMPRSVAMSDYEAYESSDYAFDNGSPAAYTDSYGGLSRSPYWSAYRNTNEDQKNRFISFVALQYDFTSWLDLKVRYGIDYNSVNFQDQLATGTPYWGTGIYTGDYKVTQNINTEQNTDFLLTGHGNLFGGLKGVFTLGGNIMSYKGTYQLTQAMGLVIPDFYSVYNGVNREAAFETRNKEVRSIYGTASLSYNDWAYLDITARNDVSSTLPSDNRSYFYPSVGGSVILTELLSNTGPISFAKIRASWAEVGNDTDPYRLKNYYRTRFVDGVLTSRAFPDKANPNLKPEEIKSFEVGADIRMLNNKIGLDFTYYKSNAFNQILYLLVPPATGYQRELINAGNVENKGIELSLFANIYDKQKFKWNLNLNFSKNSNKIVELTEDTKRQVLSDGSVSFLNIVAEEGGSYGDILGYTYQRNDAGQILVDDSGIPLASEGMSKIGNSQPDWMMGMTNSFSIYGIDVSFLIDMKYGGDIYMGSIQQGAGSGTLAMTLDGRETDFVVPNSVVQSTGAENTIAISSQNYWTSTSVQGVTEEWIYDATNIFFRELSIGYKLPKSITEKVNLSGIKLSLVGRNLFMISSNTEGFNPEGTYTTGNAQGIEYGTMPVLRSYGFNLNLTF